MLAKSFCDELVNNKISYMVGVPDSVLVEINRYAEGNSNIKCEVVANEGNAVAVAVGYHLATDSIAAVYMQNSGIGNAINPIVSLADRSVYNIPMLLIIGWRGDDNGLDEPQHIKQGNLTLELLNILGIRYSIIDSSCESSVGVIINMACKYIRNKCSIYAIVVRRGTFDKSIGYTTGISKHEMNRYEVLDVVHSRLKGNELILTSTGMISREWYEIRRTYGEGHSNDFMNVGAMGHVSQIALGIAKNSPSRTVICIEGDGSALMHMGAMAYNGTSNVKNFKHIILNNGVHGSIGGITSAGLAVKFDEIAKACGYEYSICIDSRENIESKIEKVLSNQKKSLLNILINNIDVENIGRPNKTLVNLAYEFKDSLLYS